MHCLLSWRCFSFSAPNVHGMPLLTAHARAGKDGVERGRGRHAWTLGRGAIVCRSGCVHAQNAGACLVCAAHALHMVCAAHVCSGWLGAGRRSSGVLWVRACTCTCLACVRCARAWAAAHFRSAWGLFYLDRCPAAGTHDTVLFVQTRNFCACHAVKAGALHCARAFVLPYSSNSDRRAPRAPPLPPVRVGGVQLALACMLCS